MYDRHARTGIHRRVPLRGFLYLRRARNLLQRWWSACKVLESRVRSPRLSLCLILSLSLIASTGCNPFRRRQNLCHRRAPWIKAIERQMRGRPIMTSYSFSYTPTVCFERLDSSVGVNHFEPGMRCIGLAYLDQGGRNRSRLLAESINLQKTVYNST